MNLTRPLRIFLLYARSDEKAVRRLYNRLSKAGASVWMDRKKLLPGQDWQSEIQHAIYSSDIIIVCLSKQFSKQGGYRHEEVRIALEKASGLPDNMLLIIPVRLEECDMPEPLQRWQYVDLFESYGYTKLIRTLNEYIQN